MATNVRVDAAKVAAFMRSPGGPVMRRMLLVGDKVKAVAVEELKDGFPRDFLGPQIVKRMQVVDSGPYAGPHVFVGAQHTVTRPHPIEGNPLLVFFSAKAGRVIFTRHVNHPGSNLGPYLERTLLKALEKVRGAV